jgi:hypothetical protein
MDNRLDCIGNRFNATDIVQYGFVYNVTLGNLREIKQEDIDNHFDASGYPSTLLNANVARSYTEKLSNLLPKYAQSDTESDPAPSQRLLKWIGSATIAVDDPTTDVFNDPSVSAEVFINTLSSKGFKRYGCFVLKPTVGAGAFDAIMLTLPLKPFTGDSYKLSEALGMRLLLAGTSNPDFPAVVKKVQMTKDIVAILEAAKAFNGLCKDAKIALQ